MIEDEPAAFWAYEIPPGGRLTQHVPPDTCVCLTSAVLASQSEKRCMLRASSGGYSAVLCNLFGSGMHDTAKLGQPFHSDFELMLDGASTAAVHVSGFARGDLGPVEIEEAERRPTEHTKRASAVNGLLSNFNKEHKIYADTTDMAIFFE